MPAHRILSVGQCGYDHRNLTRHLAGRLNAEIIPADTFDEAFEELRAGRFDLLLVNRVTDADETVGLDLIRSLKADPSLASIPTMLVSDHSKAQAEAVSLGALPGFGKSAINHPKTLDQLEAVLSQAGQ